MAQADDFIGQRQRRLENLTKLRELGIDPYPARSNKDKNNDDILKNFSEFQGKEVTLAGRLTTLRDHGKLIFGDLLDQSGRIQICIKKDDLQGGIKEQFIPWEHLKLIDAGDFIQVSGSIDKTQQG